MSRWNHSICYPCWLNRCEARGEPNREPVAIREQYRYVKLCCFCGEWNISGIFVREDPTSELLLCVGVHPGEEEES